MFVRRGVLYVSGQIYMSFTLAPQLEKDCYRMGRHGEIHILLNRNALFPWFVLVPECDEIEFFRLNTRQQSELVDLINIMSRFIEAHFVVDKLNVATIGNVVSQMHIHVIGRSRQDPCWPGVVWGTVHFSAYTAADVEKIRTNLITENISNL